MMAEPIRHHRRTKTTSVIKSMMMMPKTNTCDRKLPFEAEDSISMKSSPTFHAPSSQLPPFAPAGMFSFLPPDHPHSKQATAHLRSKSRISSTSSSESVMDKPTRRLRPASAAPDAPAQTYLRAHSRGPSTANLEPHRPTFQNGGARNETHSSKPGKTPANLTSIFGLNRPSRKREPISKPRDKENTTPSSPTSADSMSFSHDELHPQDRPVFSKTHTRALSSLSVRPPRPKSQLRTRQEEISLYTPSERPSREYFGPDIPRLAKVDKHSRNKSEVQPKLETRTRTPNVAQTGAYSRLSRFAPFGLKHDKPQPSDSLPEKSTSRPSLFRSKNSDSSLCKSSAPNKQSKVADVVAVFNERAKAAASSVTTAPSARTDLAKLEADFEAVLESRNIAPHQRIHMRTLKPEVKAQFIKSHQEPLVTTTTPPTSLGPSTAKSRSSKIFSTRSSTEASQEPSTEATKEPTRGRASDRSIWSTDRGRTLSLGRKKKDKEAEDTKKRRPRSRAFTFGRSDKKKNNDDGGDSVVTFLPKSPSGTSVCSLGDIRGLAAEPFSFVEYLKKSPKPEDMEVGRMHKLRLLIRNEKVEWVNEFIDLDGMQEIVELLHRIMAVEWREDHEDQLLHETLLCLKGLCTTSRGLEDLPSVASTLFPALLAMVFDRERKGPSEFNTRAIISNILFMYLSAASSSQRPARAAEILGYLRDPPPTEAARPLPWIQEMRRPRPYQVWCKEVGSVAKEVFWIFLHGLNVIPLPSGQSNGNQPLKNDANSFQNHLTPSTASSARNSTIISAHQSPAESGDQSSHQSHASLTFYQSHFPRPRPPVPAAPHVGGVEWDATNYMASHLDLLNGLIACLPTRTERNNFRTDLRASGWEKLMGGTLRKCKEKFYNSVHDGLRTWVTAAVDDEWDCRYVRMGSSPDENSSSGPKRTAPLVNLLPAVDAGSPLTDLSPAQ